jgi:hypothetical protein
MPNWCTNELYVTGDKQQLADFKAKTMNEKEEFTLDILIPTPPDLISVVSPNIYRGNDDDQEAKDVHEAYTHALKLRYGYDSWYDWRINNWGIKWDASETYYNELSEESMHVSFWSPWAPPITWVSKVAKMYPLLNFVLEYMEEGMDFCGVFEANGDDENDNHGKIKQVDENSGREVEYDNKLGGYKYVDNNEFIDDEDFSPQPENPFV